MSVRRCPVQGKISFATWDEAERARAPQERRKSGRMLTAYRCEFCPDWHLSYNGNGAKRWKNRGTK